MINLLVILQNKKKLLDYFTVLLQLLSCIFLVSVFSHSAIWPLLPDGRRLPLNRRQHIFPNGTLLLENVQNDPDQGMYQCTASNKQGRSATQTLPIKVTGSVICIML